MKTFWMTFADGSQGCCQGHDEYDAVNIAKKVSGKEMAASWRKDGHVKPLPYPANPIIWQFDHPVHGKCPSFCFDPKKCCGNTSCPKNYACSE